MLLTLHRNTAVVPYEVEPTTAPCNRRVCTLCEQLCGAADMHASVCRGKMFLPVCWSVVFAIVILEMYGINQIVRGESFFTCMRLALFFVSQQQQS